MMLQGNKHLKNGDQISQNMCNSTTCIKVLGAKDYSSSQWLEWKRIWRSTRKFCSKKL